MNLRDKLRAVGGTAPGKPAAPKPENRDCRHFAVYRPGEEFPGAWELTRETLALMSEKEMPEDFDPRRILYLDTETTGLGGSGTVAFLVGMGFLTDEARAIHSVTSIPCMSGRSRRCWYAMMNTWANGASDEHTGY